MAVACRVVPGWGSVAPPDSDLFLWRSLLLALGVPPFGWFLHWRGRGGPSRVWVGVGYRPFRSRHLFRSRFVVVVVPGDLGLLDHSPLFGVDPLCSPSLPSGLVLPGGSLGGFFPSFYYVGLGGLEWAAGGVGGVGGVWDGWDSRDGPSFSCVVSCTWCWG